jgi:hypothetical protein
MGARFGKGSTFNLMVTTEGLKVADLKNITTQRQDLLFRGAMGTTGSEPLSVLNMHA